MSLIGMFQTLAMLLKLKKALLNSHILHLTFSLVGTVDSGRETTVIPNHAAFRDLLCDLEVLCIYWFWKILPVITVVLVGDTSSRQYP